MASGFSTTETARSLVRSGMFGKDFDSAAAEITDFMGLRFGVDVKNNILASRQGVRLIEMMAFALSTANWFGDRQADDTTLYNARIRFYAAVVARQLGYQARGSVGPAVTITMTLTTPPPSRLTIEQGRQLNGPGGLAFETTEQVIFDVGVVGPKTFAAREGKSLEEIFTANGEPSQSFELTTVPDGMSVAQDSVRVFVSTVEWTANKFLLLEQTNQFEFQYGFDPARLLFGNGAAGNIPPKGAEIRVPFFVTHGTSGSVGASSVTSFTQPLVAGTTVLDAVLVQPQPSTPGSSPESVESIKTNAPIVFQAAQRAVTQLDLDGWINSFVDPTFGGVAIGRATVPRGVDQDAVALTVLQAMTNAGVTADVVTMFRTYVTRILSSNCEANSIVVQILANDVIGRYVSAPAGLAMALQGFLESIAESTAAVNVIDGSVNLLSVDTAVEIKVLPDFTSAVASQTIVAAAVAVVEGLLLGKKYGESLRISDFYAAIEALEGVDYSHCRFTNNLARVTTPGDLPILDFEVVTMGALPVVTLI